MYEVLFSFKHLLSFAFLKHFMFFAEYKRPNIVVIRVPNSGKFTLGHSELSIIFQSSLFSIHA